MSGIESVKDLIKPPFANYDIVVYFGCGLFSLPFIMHYTGSLRVNPTSFNFGIEPAFVSTLVTTLTVLFSVYILGHIIAYIGSQFIEKLMDSFFGKASTIILLGSTVRQGSLNTMIREQLRKGVAKNFTKSTWLSGLVRCLSHLPALPSYALIFIFGVFGFYRTRVSDEVIKVADEKVKTLSAHHASVKVDTQWFKPLEAIVINNNPGATARMYNYLVISGLFRSVCTILLASLWFEFVYLIAKAWGLDAPEGLLMLGNKTLLFQFISYASLSLVYVFSLFSYLKFQRRYVEDAIFAFVFTKG
jgi:hypothetical protein